MPITAGTRLGRYRLTERAGAGGMSEVWKAEDETLHRTVAVKVVQGPIASDATYRDRFLREARLVAGLEHPCILPVYDFGTETVDGLDVPFLVMPLVGGGSLKEKIRGGVPPAQAVTWLASVASALDHAHSKGILHRDIKPGNVLMGVGDRPLLADFGLARAVESASALTQTGTVLGTPLYMSPEQATGKALDARADQYALAVIAFEMLAGRVPFSADSPLAVLHQHVAVPPPPISQASPSIPGAADAVLDRALAKNAADRFASCTEFVASLAQALGVPLTAATAPLSLPISTTPSRPLPPPLPPPPPQPALSQEATVISDATPRPSGMAAPASRVSVAPRRGLLLAVPFLVLAAAGGFLFLLRSRGPAATVAQLPPTPLPEPPLLPTAAPTVNPEPTPGPAPTAAPPPTEAPMPTAAPVPTTPEATAKERIASRAAPPASRGSRDRWTRDAPPDSPPARDERREHAAAPPLPRREPLLAADAASGDTTLGGAYAALDASHRPEGRLDRADFVSAMGEAREAASRRRSADAVFLDAFARAGVAFADGQRQQAWLLLRRALENDPGAASSRTLRFVRREVAGLGPNPGPDADWVMGLAFGDVRGEVDEELAKAAGRADSGPVAYARALRAIEKRDASEARRLSRRACDLGLKEACEPVR